MTAQNDTAYQVGYIFGILLVAGLGIGFIIFAIIAVVKAFTKKTTGWIVTACLSGLLMIGILGAFVVAVVAGVVTAVNSASGNSPNIQLSSKDGIYSFDVPSAWKEMPKLNPAASLGAGNGLREQYLMLFVDSKEDFKGSLESFSKLVTERIAKKMQGSALGEVKHLTINGHPAHQRRISGTANNLGLVYLHTSVELPDSYCQILCWTLTSKESTAFPVFEKVIPTFTTKAADKLDATAHIKKP